MVMILFVQYYIIGFALTLGFAIPFVIAFLLVKLIREIRLK